ncbi:ABC transporter ATP-binding protein [Candidatus Bathyarchaeota archaeon]|nr:ABC transporter ATP-binding protein [Candidatus Bathyarchaeota archaeon]
MTDAILEVNAINVYYGAIQALRDLTIKVNEGEIVTVLGANGAGKTTLLRTIAGLLHPHSGQIRFFDQRIDGKKAHKISQMGICLVPEGRKLFTSMTVIENLEMGAYAPRVRKNRKELLKQVFELFPILEERKKQKAGTLSGGEQQMLAIGRALMSQPKLLMLDEPSLGLAPKIARKVIDTVKEANEQLGLTILLVEQNAKMALEIANRGYIIERGSVVLEGKNEELKDNKQVKEAYLGI